MYEWDCYSGIKRRHIDLIGLFNKIKCSKEENLKKYISLRLVDRFSVEAVLRLVTRVDSFVIHHFSSVDSPLLKDYLNLLDVFIICFETRPDILRLFNCVFM